MQTFKLEVTEEDIKIIGAALDELPRKYSNSVVLKLQTQINEQLKTDTE